MANEKTKTSRILAAQRQDAKGSKLVKRKEGAKPKKPYAIEYRYTPEYAKRWSWSRKSGNAWEVRARYATRKQRDQAITTYRKQGHDFYEYRSKDNE